MSWEYPTFIGEVVNEDHPIITAWWLTYPSEKWSSSVGDDDIPNIWKVIKAMFQTTNQNVTSLCLVSHPHVSLLSPRILIIFIA